jgi:hypothetical protein
MKDDKLPLYGQDKITISACHICKTYIVKGKYSLTPVDFQEFPDGVTRQVYICKDCLDELVKDGYQQV